MLGKASIASFPVDYEALDQEFNAKCWEIKKLKQNILELEAEIDECHDMRNSPQHIYLHEALMLNIEKLDDIVDNNWEEMLELKTQAIKFGYNMLERLEIRISNNEQLENFQNSPKVLVTPSVVESDFSSLEDEYTFTRKIENNVKFQSRKVQGYKDISKYFQVEPKSTKVERKRLKSEDAETQTEDELDVQNKDETEKLNEVNTNEIEEDPSDVIEKIPEEAKQRRRSSAKDIVRKLERSTSIEERFQQVTVKNTNVDILKYFQSQPKNENAKVKHESQPKQQAEVETAPVEDLIQDDEEVANYFQRHKSLEDLEDVDGKFEEAFAQLNGEVDEDEVKPKLSVRERVKRMNSIVGEKQEDNLVKEENGINQEELVEAKSFIDENQNEVFKPRLSVKERIKRMNEGKLEENAEEKNAQNRIDQDEVANVQLKDLKKHFEKPGFPLVFK